MQMCNKIPAAQNRPLPLASLMAALPARLLRLPPAACPTCCAASWPCRCTDVNDTTECAQKNAGNDAGQPYNTAAAVASCAARCFARGARNASRTVSRTLDGLSKVRLYLEKPEEELSQAPKRAGGWPRRTTPR